VQPCDLRDACPTGGGIEAVPGSATSLHADADGSEESAHQISP